jgi:SAM-dependent methyltransferase
MALELVSPVDGRPLSLQVFEKRDDLIISGVFREHGGGWHPIIEGLPIFLSGALQPDLTEFARAHGLPYSGATHDDSGQAHTTTTFSDKWRRYRSYGWLPEHWRFHAEWFCKKLGVKTEDDLKSFYTKFDRVLECGTGSGFNLNFISQYCPGEVFGLDISDAARTSYSNLWNRINVTIVQADLFHAPFPDDWFDFIIADGVLHHTPSTRGAVEALLAKVRPGGKFFFYIYRRMGASRYFADNHIREAFSKLSPEECYEACRPITELGRALSALQQRFTLDNPIDVLGLPAGEHNIQRFFYYGFLKCFWNESFDFETNNMINYDWYHPHHAWQHTDEEVHQWMAELGVTEYSINDANPNGISVLLTKPAR